ncbi:MAG: DUF502 domain-containing protein [Planctomycetota bacterium]
MNLKRIFITGIILLLPTLITIVILTIAIQFLNGYIAQPLGGLALSILNLVTDLSILKEHAALFRALIGFPIALLIVIFVGYLATMLGRWIFIGVEKYLLLRIPVVSLIYPYAKQLIDTFLNKDKKREFKSVVAVEYPRKGIYSIGFVTSEGLKDVNTSLGKQTVTIFMPSSPTPFTGWTIMVPKEDIININMTVDDAIRFVVSGGILTPNGAISKEVVHSGTLSQQ